MAEISTAQTGQLGHQELRLIRAFLDEAFAGDFTDDDFDHTLGGLHALAWEDSVLVGHGSVVLRRLVHAGRSLRTGYVEGVAVRADRRRHGHGAAVMSVLEEVIRRGYVLGALSSSAEGRDFYAARDWQVWTGTASALTPGGIVRTPEDDGGIYLLPMDAGLNPDGDLACDWRDGDLW